MDGVSVSNTNALSSSFQNIGIHLLKEAASKTNDIAGVGTTIATILAQARVHEEMKNLAVSANAIEVSRQHGKIFPTIFLHHKLLEDCG